MLRVERALSGYEIEATDSKVGSVSDVLFDDVNWRIRWLVVETGGWLSGRKVLIHPSAIGQADNSRHQLSVKLTKQQIEESPAILQDQPVSRQMEASLYGYYGWDPLWSGGYYGWDPLWGGQCLVRGAMAQPLVAPPFFGGTARRHADWGQVPLEDQDPHLRSATALTSYHLVATDGEIGHLESFLLDDESWTIRYLLIDTRNWWFGKHVLLAPFAVTEIDWSSSKIRLNVPRDQVRTSPAWQPDDNVSGEYERRLHLHYGWPGYGW